MCVRGFMDLHWDVLITSAMEISVCYFVCCGPYSVKYEHNLEEMCVWASLDDTQSSS